MTPTTDDAGHVAVLGAGCWATAFAAVLADAGRRVQIWARRPGIVSSINAGQNAEYLPALDLPPTVSATGDPAEALTGADLVVIAVPAQSLRELASGWADHLPAQAPVVSLMKGLELGTGLRMTEILGEVAGVPPERQVAISGPNLAGEIARKQPAATIVACTEMETARRVAGLCATSYFRPYPHADVIGAEIGGTVKNVVALAVGMAEGMSMGDNTQATIITRGLAEITRLAVRVGAEPQTLMGLAGVGDLIATSMSPMSRNRTFGVNLGAGMTIDEVLAMTRATTEGASSCRAVLDLAGRHGVEMPIAAAVAAVVDGRNTPRQVVEQLMARERKHERI
ncbi:MAG: glycerol-3-phosphate dehydrogenase [Actinomycetales bacterium]|nr:MAG: glycerol-3-phosphate dehydrogenase [Actinomycetales bacterium]